MEDALQLKGEKSAVGEETIYRCVGLDVLVTVDFL